MTSGPSKSPVPRTPTSSPGPAEADDPITIAFAGDVHFQSHLRPLLDNPATGLAPIRAQLGAADLMVVNLETSVTTRGTPEDKRFTFRTAPSAFDALAAAGVDVVTMANNHAVDYGAVGLADSLDAAADAPLAVVGIGTDAAHAYAPHVATVRGTKIAVIGASAVSDPTSAHFTAGTDTPGIASALDPVPLLAAVRAAQSSADVVVVYLHWGRELVGCPTDDQRELARQLAAAGADIVAGAHAHVQLGAGLLDGSDTFVAYGLGNFVWYNRSSEKTINTGVLTVTMTGRRATAANWAPATVGETGLPRFATGERARELRRGWEDLRSCADLRGLPQPPV